MVSKHQARTCLLLAAVMLLKKSFTSWFWLFDLLKRTINVQVSPIKCLMSVLKEKHYICFTVLQQNQIWTH